MTLRFKRDAAERIFFTAVEAVLGVVSAQGVVEVFEIDNTSLKGIIVVSLTSVFAASKTYVARRVGDKNSAALMK